LFLFELENMARTINSLFLTSKNFAKSLKLISKFYLFLKNFMKKKTHKKSDKNWKNFSWKSRTKSN